MLSSRPSPSEITAQHQTNVATMSRIKSKVLPLKAAATNLAETARQLKDYATQLEQNGQRQITSPNGERVAAKDLIRSLNRAKDAIKSLESELTSLGREVDFFSAHQIELFQGKTRAVSVGVGVGWCAVQVSNIKQSANRLAQSEQSTAENAVKTIQNLAYTLGRPAVTSNLSDLLAGLA